MDPFFRIGELPLSSISKAFRKAEETKSAFHFPNFYVLPNILLGLRFR
jgi:hypothetical protein